MYDIQIFKEVKKLNNGKAFHYFNLTIESFNDSPVCNWNL